jgi:hypothetical protein
VPTGSQDTDREIVPLTDQSHMNRQRSTFEATCTMQDIA